MTKSGLQKILDHAEEKIGDIRSEELNTTNELLVLIARLLVAQMRWGLK